MEIEERLHKLRSRIQDFNEEMRKEISEILHINSR